MRKGVLSIAIVATHPIQYQAPWFRALSAQPGIDLKVYFAMSPDADQQGIGFGSAFQWDIALRDGYASEVLPNARHRPGLGGFWASSTPDIRAVLERARPDAVLVTGWNALPLVQATWACKRLGIPVMVRGDSNDMKPRPLWVRFCHRALLAQFDAFMAVGLANRTFYLCNGVDEASIFSAPHFVDNARFRVQCEAARLRRTELRAGWSVPEDAVCFSFVGKIERKKHLPDLIAAVARVAAQGLRVHLLVVGSGEQLPYSRDLAAQLAAPVTFAGFLNQTQLGAAYAVTDCLVLPSDHGETWGLVVNEAMACGIPALVSDRVGCGPDLVEEGQTGGRFAFGDVEAMAVAIRSLASRPGELREMGARARDRVSGYSVERAVGGTLEALRHVTAESPAGR